MSRNPGALSARARAGFTALTAAGAGLQELEDRVSGLDWLQLFSAAADPDRALAALLTLLRTDEQRTVTALAEAGRAERLIRVLGASNGLAEFLRRHPAELDVLSRPMSAPPSADTYRSDLLRVAGDQLRENRPDAEVWSAIRRRYRRHVTALAAWDLTREDQLAAIDQVTAALSDLAAAALEASLLVARATVPHPAADVEATRLAVIGMGKAGARELNYVSDVDVIFVVDGGELDTHRAVTIASALAVQTMRGIQEYAGEPPLWEVDANLRPEGKDGALVRTLESHVAYYERWAKGWEFQALMKARPLAGDAELGRRYLDALQPLVWSSASRDGFVQGVQQMRQRVTDNIPPRDVDIQLKLGPGGIRDIEFTIQLLQLVHGQHDDSIRQAGTLPALRALADGGYIGRAEAASFARDYRLLRVLEHRLQLTGLTRTHRMPTDVDDLRTLARASGLATTAQELLAVWQETKRSVRSLHERLFYRPLLSAVAGLPEDAPPLSSEAAAARLAATGFIDPSGALEHIRALTAGVSRSAQIQRTLLPVMLQWFAEGADPDFGLLSFRRLSADLGNSHWFLRMLRDSSVAARRLTTVLAGSRFVGTLLEVIPEAAAWLGNDADLAPRPAASLLDEARAIVARHDTVEAAAQALRTARRREVLRLALGSILGLIDVRTLGHALSDVTTALLEGLLSALRREPDGIEFGIIAMGRYGGQELGFGSDMDVMYVYRPGEAGERSQRWAEQLVVELRRHTEDLRLPLDLDIDLRPEGKNGPVARSLDSYRAYYDRWSLTWEAQALLRARGVVGDPQLLQDFDALADEVRFPSEISERDVREVKRIKARVETERLPQAADPSRHLKLGRGSLSDVEWFVQLIQMRHGAAVPGLRTTSTLDALDAAVAAGFVNQDAATRLREAWLIASRARSAMTLWSVRTSDVLPVDMTQLEGVARLMGYPPGCASQLEDDYLRITRLARSTFETGFYGAPLVAEPTDG